MSHLNNEAAQLLQPSMRTVSPERGNIQDHTASYHGQAPSPKPRTTLKVLQNWLTYPSEAACTSLSTDNKYADTIHLLICYCFVIYQQPCCTTGLSIEMDRTLLRFFSPYPCGQCMGTMGGAEVQEPDAVLEADWRRGTSGYYLLLWLQIGP